MAPLALAVVVGLVAEPVDRRYVGSTAAVRQTVETAAPAHVEQAASEGPSEPPENVAEPAHRTNEDDDAGVKTVRVKTEKLGESTEADAFKHAGARKVVTSEDWAERGASSVSEVVDRVPGVRALEGISGIGSTATKLNVAVRGSNPRLSSSATVLLDEIPLAVAPYGQPELSLFPVSLFSIDRIDAVSGGASVRFGPQTSGGVFNLISKPIPALPQWSVASQVDSFGLVNIATAFGTTVDKFGVYVEYAPQFGRSFRENSELNAHGGLLKLRYEFSPRLEIQSLTHGYGEHSGIPGGLDVAAYQENRFQSIRDDDYFEGWRIGEAIKLIGHPHPDHALQANFFYNHSYRFSQMWHQDATPEVTLRLPRTYDVVGLEPRYTGRLRHRGGAYHVLSAGVRGVLETAKIQQLSLIVDTDNYAQKHPLDLDVDARLGALAAFVEDELYLFDETLVLRAGVRLEVARISRLRNPTGAEDPMTPIAPVPGVEDEAERVRRVLSRTYIEPLPAGSIWYSPQENLAFFVGYQRSFGPPTFVQAGLALASNDLLSEYTNTIDGGVKLYDRYGMWANVTGFHRWFRNIRDIGENTVDAPIASAWARGVESEVGWEPGEVWDALTGSEAYLGTSVMRSRVTQSRGYDAKELPWYPRVEFWGGLTYAFPWHCGLGFGHGPSDCRAWRIGGDAEWSAEQYTDYANRDQDADGNRGAVGLVPAYTLLNLHTTLQAALPRAFMLNITVGIKNVLDTEWYYRTDDINRGILPQRPRTYYVRIDISHFFLRAAERAQERRERRRTKRQEAIGAS